MNTVKKHVHLEGVHTPGVNKSHGLSNGKRCGQKTKQGKGMRNVAEGGEAGIMFIR